MAAAEVVLSGSAAAGGTDSLGQAQEDGGVAEVEAWRTRV